MVNEKELCQALQFLATQPSWVMKDIPNQNKSEVLTMALIPKNSGVYWIAGETRLFSGQKLESVFRTDSNGGSFVAVYWKINGKWYQHEDSDTLSALGLSKQDVFPFDWSFAIPLEDDCFHEDSN